MTRAAAQAERIGLEHTAEFCRILRSVPLAGKSYLACLAELMDGLATRSDASAVCAPSRAAPRRAWRGLTRCAAAARGG